MAAQLIIGGLIGVAIGMVISKKPEKGKLSPSPCDTTGVSFWIDSRGLRGGVLSVEPDLAGYLPESQGGDIPDAQFDPSNVAVTQDTCTVYRWDGTSWIIDNERTADLAEYLRTGTLQIQARRVQAGLPPVSRPSKGIAPPPGPREAPP